jgi:hypothetical protein
MQFFITAREMCSKTSASERQGEALPCYSGNDLKRHDRYNKRVCMPNSGLRLVDSSAELPKPRSASVNCTDVRQKENLYVSPQGEEIILK